MTSEQPETVSAQTIPVLQTPLFDTHAHYDSGRFRDDCCEVLSALPGAGVKLVVNPGCDVPSSQMAVALSARFPHVYAAAGIHPEDCANTSDADFEQIRQLCAQTKTVAVGEIGLDYHWKDNPPADFQKFVFRTQMDIAAELDLPVIVHDRDAHADSMTIIRDYPHVRGVFHCYSGSAEMARELLKRGWYLGFDGPVTYPNARRAAEVFALTPMDRFVIETDSPYLTPVPFRGKRNDSRYLPYVVQTLARWKNVDPEEIARAAWENGKRLYRMA